MFIGLISLVAQKSTPALYRCGNPNAKRHQSVRTSSRRLNWPCVDRPDGSICQLARQKDTTRQLAVAIPTRTVFQVSPLRFWRSRRL